jgi:hypothetical protein
VTPVPSLDDHAVALTFLEATVLHRHGRIEDAAAVARDLVVHIDPDCLYTVAKFRRLLTLLDDIMEARRHMGPTEPETRAERLARLRQERRDRLKDTA